MQIDSAKYGSREILLDDCWRETVAQHRWFLDKRANRRAEYAYRHVGDKTQLMHRFIWSLARPGENIEGLQIDHINENGLDNRVVNLRIATSSQNKHNVKLKRNNTSGVKGVYWNTARNLWQAQIAVNNKRICVGRFENIEEAKAALEQVRTRLHKDFSNHGEGSSKVSRTYSGAKEEVFT